MRINIYTGRLARVVLYCAGVVGIVVLMRKRCLWA